MIVTDKFILTHMHKTGGQTLNQVIQNCIPDHQVIGYHYPLDMLPEKYVDLPVIGIVRNPWDWYVSWYAFNLLPNVTNMLFDVLSDGGHANFKDTVTNLINLGSNELQSQHYRHCLEIVFPESLEGNRGVGLRKSDIRNFTDDDTGYYSWLFNRMHGDIGNQNLIIGRQENLEESFLEIMEQLAVEERDCIRQEFSKVGRSNSSRHQHYSAYYDDELMQLLAEKERSLIDHFGYSFEDNHLSRGSIKFPIAETTSFHRDFQKPSGNSKNFLLLKEDYDVGSIIDALEQLPPSAWLKSARDQRYEAHRNTQALNLIYDSDFRHVDPTYHDLYEYFESELQPLIDLVSNFYQTDGFVVRLIFTMLKAHQRIPLHKDKLYTLINCHRIHVPIRTNDQVTFLVGGEEKRMQVGEIWEINNATYHRVVNHSDEERVHLILDWVPNITIPAGDLATSSSSISKQRNPGNIFKNTPRNALCPCGSGRRYKHCHGAIN